MAYIDQFLQIVVRQGASDLHIAEGQPPKIRTHGDIMPMRDEPISREEATRMLSEVCGSKNWEIFEQHEISISLTRWISTLGFAPTILNNRMATARLSD